MARPVWSGSISFGLVNVPVKAYPAVHDHTVHFHQLEKRTGRPHPLREGLGEDRARRCPPTTSSCGYELAKGEYVVVDPDELDALRPAPTRDDRRHRLRRARAPSTRSTTSTPTGWRPTATPPSRAYRLLLAAMDEAAAGRASARVVMRNKQYLAAVRPLDGVLAMSTMRFADEVVPRTDIDGLPDARQAGRKQLRLATQIIDALAAEWDPKRYHDTYTEELRERIERQGAQGQSRSYRDRERQRPRPHGGARSERGTKAKKRSTKPRRRIRT